MKPLLSLLLLVPALALARDPYADDPAGDSLQDTAREPFREKFSLDAAAAFLDRRAHLFENRCYACHSTFTYLPARTLTDPLAPEVMRTRVMLERIMALLLDPTTAASVKTQHVLRHPGPGCLRHPHTAKGHRGAVRRRTGQGGCRGACWNVPARALSEAARPGSAHFIGTLQR
jgi:hypothetical protein